MSANTKACPIHDTCRKHVLTLSRLRQLGNQLKQVCLLNLMPVLQKTVIRLLITFIQAGSCKLLQTSHQQLPEFCCLLVHASTCHSPTGLLREISHVGLGTISCLRPFSTKLCARVGRRISSCNIPILLPDSSCQS